MTIPTAIIPARFEAGGRHLTLCLVFLSPSSTPPPSLFFPSPLFFFSFPSFFAPRIQRAPLLRGRAFCFSVFPASAKGPFGVCFYLSRGQRGRPKPARPFFSLPARPPKRGRWAGGRKGRAGSLFFACARERARSFGFLERRRGGREARRALSQLRLRGPVEKERGGKKREGRGEKWGGVGEGGREKTWRVVLPFKLPPPLKRTMFQITHVYFMSERKKNSSSSFFFVPVLRALLLLTLALRSLSLSFHQKQLFYRELLVL